MKTVPFLSMNTNTHARWLGALALIGAALLAAPALAEDPASSPPDKTTQPSAVGADGQLDIKALSQRLDRLYRAKSSKGKVAMAIVTPHYKRTLVMEMTTRGMDDTLIRIVSPRKERGISTLKKGNEMWNYLPKVKKVIKIPPSMMTSSWMGSDMTNDDLVRSSSWEDDYTAALDKAESSASEFCVRYTPRPTAAVTWSKVVGCFDRKTELPTRQDFYDEKQRKVRTMRFDRVQALGGRVVPTRMTIMPLSPDKKGHMTVMQFNEMQYDAPVDDRTFSLTNLRRAD